MSQTHKYSLPIPAAGALAANLRVKYDGSFNFEAAGASDLSLGTLEKASFAAGDVRNILLHNPGETQVMVAAGVIAKGVTVYAAASGKIADSGTIAVGTSAEAAGANGDWIEVIPAGPVTADGDYATVTGTETLTNKTLTTPVIGAATGTSLTATGLIKSTGTAGIGYGTGAGGTVTQITTIATGVTLDKTCGTITTVSSTLAAGVDASFTLTNSTIAATDVVVASIKSYGGTADGIPTVYVTATAAGSCVLTIRNTGAVTLDAVIVISFAVIKAVAA
jgi:hypothetical protein